ncbi:MAG: LD-carboxypeptidase [Desulfobulbaceae bacterium]|nr:LD-carboxypeptidase [Desulfobulbaceae bacterium]
MSTTGKAMYNRLTLPPSLSPGDTIGLFSPAGPVRDAKHVEAGIRVLRDAGFLVEMFEQPQSVDGYLAAPDDERVRNMHTLWADDRVKALMVIRGGFGCLRLVDKLDMELFHSRPKFLIGFSDVTVLHSGIRQYAGLVTIHGPMLTTLGMADQQSVHYFFSVITGRWEEYAQLRNLEILQGGTGRGVLAGGNLTTLVHLIGTPWEIPWEDSILVLEDTGESMYRLDRMLTQLACSGKLDRLRGLILGGFDNGNEDRLENLRLQEQVWERVLELLPHAPYPIWANFPVGHGRQNLALPMGIEATMDGRAGVLRLHPESVTKA